jgi:DNA-binding response OmpR family regulator
MYHLMQRPGIPNAMSHRDQRGSRRDTPIESATRILIVDGDRQVGTSLTFMLAARGYDDVRAVRSARRAVAIAEVFRPGLVFLDLELPDQGALEVADLLRRGARLQAMRLIALTSNNEHESREEARVAGFERYLVKPLAQSELDKILGSPAEPLL